ncbi:MAG: hypothetical protein ACYSWW_25210 [Planctomycetota bacterium]|jgi:hypothetical protein
MMVPFNWAKSFEEQPTCEDILNKVRKIEMQYWIGIACATFMILAGIVLIVSAPEHDIKKHNWGVFLAVWGGIILAMSEICACVKVWTLKVIWDRQNRLEQEMRKSEALDL